MIWYVSTLPYAEPVSLDEMKLHLRVDGTDEDALIRGLIQAAREYCENFQNRAYVTQTITLKLDCFPSTTSSIQLPRPPLCKVDSVTYIDLNGVTQTFDSSKYVVNDISEPGEIYLGYNQQWPSDVRTVPNAVTVSYKAGYATPFTFNATTDVVTTAGRSFTDGAVVRVSVSGSNSAVLPTGLSANTDYYVINASGNTCKLSTSAGGSAIDLSGGTGAFFIGEIPASVKTAMKLLVGHWYENRETVNIGNITSTLEFTVKALLGMNKVYNT
jgi:uncharacterized phiE125 gp8 family phage protein